MLFTEKFNFLISNITYLFPNLSEVLSLFVVLFLLCYFFYLGSIFEKKESNGILINIFCGWSITLIFVLIVQILFLNNILYSSAVSFLLGLYLIIKNKKIKKLKHISFKKFLIFTCILPLLLVLISHKLRNWDTFTHWMLLSDTIYFTNKLPVNVFHDYYVPSLYYFEFLVKRIIFNPEVENVYIILYFYLIICVAFTILKIFKDDFRFFPFVFLWIIISPIFINFFTFSSYNDFGLSCLLFTVYYFIYIKNLNIFGNRDNLTIFILLNSLIVLTKTEGIIHSFVISSLIFFYEFNLNKFKNFKKIIIYFISISFIYFLWKYHLYANSIDVRSIGNPFQNKMYFDDFLNGLRNNILSKKLFYICSIILLIYSFFGKKLIYNSVIKIYFVHLIIFSIFIIIFTFGAFPPEHIKKASSFWRYSSQLNGPLLILFSILIFSNNFFQKFILKFSILFFIISCVTPLILINKYRHDLFSNSFYIQKNIKLLREHIKKGDRVTIISNKPHYHSMILYYYLPKKIKYNRADYNTLEIVSNNIKIKDPQLYNEDYIIYLDKNYTSKEKYLIIVKDKSLKKL